MKIDWKYVSTTPGYRSLKKAYTDGVEKSEKEKCRFGRPMRSKLEFLRHFNWVISRAKHYAYVHQKPIEVILNDWESKRSYWWLNYYQDCNQPKLHNNILKPRKRICKLVTRR